MSKTVIQLKDSTNDSSIYPITDSRIVYHGEDRLSDIITNITDDLEDVKENQNYLNVNTLKNKTTPYGSRDAAHADVDVSYRERGMCITYMLNDASTWINEQFIGDSSTGWGTASNWKTLGPVSASQDASTGKTTIKIGTDSYDVATNPVSVSQNTETGHTDITIGDTTTPVASVEEVSQLGQKVNTKVFTQSEAANKVIRHLFIDVSNYTGSYSTDGIFLKNIYSDGSSQCGFIIGNENNDTLAYHWYDSVEAIQEWVVNGIYAYAEFNWNNLVGDRILNIELTSEAFEPYNDKRGKISTNRLANNSVSTAKLQDSCVTTDKIANVAVTENKIAESAVITAKIADNSITTAKLVDEAVTKNKVASTFRKELNTKVFTTDEIANKVFRHLFIDVSGYTGALSTNGLYLKNIYNDGTGQCGFIIGNENEETLANYWYYVGNVSIQEWVVNGIYAYAEFNWNNLVGDRILNIELTSEAFEPYNDPRKKVIENEYILGAAGDSITNAANYPINDDGDLFNPISGNKNFSWAYYIAKKYGIKWHNYGNSGSTLGDCIVADYDQRGFSKENGRYTQMANDLTHITIWFGWNDNYYGPRMRKQMWVQETYHNTHWYPANNDAQYIGQDGYVTQEEYDAVNSVTGVVGGITYNNSQEYWNAVYVGTKDDNTNKTFWGAWNVVLPYLINKYPYAKILLISPYNTSELIRQAVRDAAFKYGLQCYDFGKDQNQMFAYGWQDENEQGMIGSQTVEQFRVSTLLYDGTHPNLDGNKYIAPSIGARLMAL